MLRPRTIERARLMLMRNQARTFRCCDRPVEPEGKSTQPTLDGGDGSAAASSLPACAAVQPFSTAHLEMMFAFSDLKAVCPGGGGCSMKVSDVEQNEP